MNWLKISDVIRGTRLDQLFFPRRPGINYTGGLNWTFVLKDLQNSTVLDITSQISLLLLLNIIINT